MSIGAARDLHEVAAYYREPSDEHLEEAVSVLRRVAGARLKVLAKHGTMPRWVRDHQVKTLVGKCALLRSKRSLEVEKVHALAHLVLLVDGMIAEYEALATNPPPKMRYEICLKLIKEIEDKITGKKVSQVADYKALKSSYSRSRDQDSDLVMLEQLEGEIHQMRQLLKEARSLKITVASMYHRHGTFSMPSSSQEADFRKALSKLRSSASTC